MLEVPFELHYRKFRFDDDEFYDFCLQNDNLKFERDSIGNVIVMPNTGGKTGNLNSKLNARLVIWNEILESGLVFDSSTAFRLPSSAVRSPDVAWVSNERWNMLSDSEQEKFPPLCPDFVIELMSVTDNETDAKMKMTDEWIANGCKLAWLINPYEKKAFVYRPNQAVETIYGFENKLSGEEILNGFLLNLQVLE